MKENKYKYNNVIKVTRSREKGAFEIEAGWESNRKSGIAIWKQFEN